MNRYKKQNRTNQQIKEQINFVLEDVEKNLEEYKRTLELKEKQLSHAKKKKKYLFLPKIDSITQ